MCDKYSADAVDAFIEWEGEDLDNFDGCYIGEFDSEEDFARHLINEHYDLEKMMGSLAEFFDYEAFANSLFDDDYYYDNGFVFSHY